MAVVTRPCGGVFPCVKNGSCHTRTSQNGWALKSILDFIKTQLCTIAISLTLFNSVRLPREAYRHGTVPYMVVYCFWLMIVGLPVTLLQLAMGQLSQQDPAGVWRAVPILRGIGYLKILTSYLCCVYNMVYISLSLAFLVWIGKGSFPLKECTKLYITPNGYENKMNASECFNTTFLAPFTEQPQYLGIMAILIFVLWFFVPLLLYHLYKSLKTSLCILAPLVVVIGIVLFTFLSDSIILNSIFESCEQWMPLSQPYIWHSALVQAILSTQVVSGYLISASGTVYRHSDVRWTSMTTIATNLIAGWLWVLFWESIGGNIKTDLNFITILVLIYQSSVIGKRTKEWPLLAFGVVNISGIITVLILLFPIYDKLHRFAGENWRLFASASSAVGTGLTVAVLIRGLDVAAVLDELVVSVLAVFTTAVEVIGFIFIYGWSNLAVDIEFLTGVRMPCICVVSWWATPFLLLGVTGWWLRTLLRATWNQEQTLWPLVGVFIGILVIMIATAAIAVAKEEQYNLLTKIASAFRPSRLWGPEEPLARYVWMSQRYAKELSNDNDVSEPNNYPDIFFNQTKEKIYNEDWLRDDETYQRTYNAYDKGLLDKDDVTTKAVKTIYSTYTIPRSKRNKIEEKFRSPNICIAEGKLGGPIQCNCNRHFTLNVPDLRKNEISTSL